MTILVKLSANLYFPALSLVVVLFLQYCTDILAEFGTLKLRRNDLYAIIHEEKRWGYGGADRTKFTAFLSKVVLRVGALPRLDAHAASPVGRHVCTLFPVMILFVMASVAVDEEWPVE